MITNGMYNDEAPFYEGLYGQDDPDMSNFKAWGHFSQIAWRSTKEIGCATVECGTLQKAGGTRPFFTVCNYAPPGNFGGEYTNVALDLASQRSRSSEKNEKVEA
jgi:Cysteine-rich secretory protein family